MPTRALALGQHALGLIDEDAEPLRAAVMLERLGRYAYLSGREADALTYYERGGPRAGAPAHTGARTCPRRARDHPERAPAGRCRRASRRGHRRGAPGRGDHRRGERGDDACGRRRRDLGDVAAALTGFEDAARLTEIEGDIESTSRLWVNRTYALFGLGLIEEAAAVPPEARAAMREVGLEHSAMWIANWALPLIDLGRWDEARLLLDAEVSIEGLDPGRDNILQARVWLNWLTGDLPGAEQDLAMLDLTRSQDTYQAQGVACVAIETRRWEAAVAATAEAVRSLPLESGHPTPHWEALTAVWLGLWAARELSSERGEAGASWLAPSLADFDDLLASAAMRPADRRPVRYRALLALCAAERSRVDGRMSSADWRQAVVETDALGAVAQRSYARVRYAEALLGEGGGRAEATTLLNEAVALFADIRQAPIRLLAEQVGRRARLRLTVEPEVMTPVGEKQLGLTQREVEVLRLVADARTNREIGDAPFMSPKTASVHVSSVMRKIGVNRRADAARLAKQVLVDYPEAEIGRSAPDAASERPI